MKFSCFAFILICSNCLYSCGKSDEIPPTITVTMPAENQVFTNIQPVSVQAAISDNEGIHMIHLAVTDIMSGGHMLHFEEHFDGRSYSLNNSFPVQQGRSYLIEIEATDHHENITKKQLTVSVN